MFVPIAVTLMTVYSLGVDIYRKPSLVTDWLFANHTTYDPTPLFNPQGMWDIDTPITPVLTVEEVTATTPQSTSLLDIPVEKEHVSVLSTGSQVRHRTTRRRSSMDLIRSLSA